MSLIGFTNIGDSTITNDVVENLISYFDWGLMQKGGFSTISLSDEDSTLSLLKDPRYTNGQVWQGQPNWIWESGIADSVSGVYVNNTFYTTSTTGTYEYIINYPYGQVIFDNAISTTSTVKCEYSYKEISVVRCGGIEWFKRILTKSDENDDYPDLRQHSVSLPCIGIEYVGRNLAGAGLGGRRYVYTDILFHCVAEDSYTRDNLVDIVSLQDETTFFMYDLDQIATNDDFPLNHNGTPISGAKQYDELVSSYRDRSLRIFNMKSDRIYNVGNIFIGTLKCTVEVIPGV